MKRLFTLVLLTVLLAPLAAYSATTNYAATALNDPRLKTFAQQKRKQMEELASKLHLPVPTEAREFFRAAEAGDWIAVSNRFEEVYRLVGSSGVNMPLPGLRNVLYVPIHETWGAYATFRGWDGAMLEKFADGVLSSVSTGSVYFGGTDAGRFIITMVRDVGKSPDVVVATPKYIETPLRPPWQFIVTQNGVQDSLYMDYLRLVYGGKLWVPSTTDMQNAFQQYVSEEQSRQSRGERSDVQVSTNQEGKVQVVGVGGVMAVDSLATKMIFDHNKDQHDFYVEESYVIPWMYPYLEPHGLIMKLNREPMKELDPALITQDRQFWDSLTRDLLADRHFTSNNAARKTFSKLRSAIGGLYTNRRLTAEAEAAFKQAVELCPTSPEANFRLAQLYMEQNRFDDAIAVMKALQQRDPFDKHLQDAIEQLREMKRRAEEKKAK